MFSLTIRGCRAAIRSKASPGPSEQVERALDDDRGWVVDGNYESKLGTMILDRAKLVVWLDLPLKTKLRRLAHRTGRRWLLNETLWNGNRETLQDIFGGARRSSPGPYGVTFAIGASGHDYLMDAPVFG